MKREPSEEVVTQRVLYFVCQLESYEDTGIPASKPCRGTHRPVPLDDRVTKVMLFSTN